MRSRFVGHLVDRNAVLVLGFGLPLLIFGSTTLQRAAIIGGAVLVVLPVSHAVSFGVEQLLRKSLRKAALLVIAATVITVYEAILRTIVPEPGFRTLLFMRLLVADCMLVWPFLRSNREETFQHRIEHALGLSLGFTLVLALFAVLREAMVVAGWNLAASTAVAFFVVGYAKALQRWVGNRR